MGAQVPPALGRYHLLARLASGGMGEIFLARLEGVAGFEKVVVIKRILPHLADDPRFRQMLISEARLASRLNHANICQVIELGETDGQLYIVMEYLVGVTLLPLLRKMSREHRMLDLGFIGGVVQQASDALHYAHELKDRLGESLGIVHRDVTPANLFLTEAGVVKVLDFGIAKVKDASATTQTGTVKGKYAYMAPEQLRGGVLDRRVDVFALGVCVYEMLALRRLFQRDTDYLTFNAVMEQPTPDVRRYRPDVPEELAHTLTVALDRTPDNRYDSVRNFGSAILDAIASVGRTWTQGQISDFVRREFAPDLEKRSRHVAKAVQQSAAGQRISLSSFLLEPEGTHLDDEDALQPVEDTVNEPTAAMRAGRPPSDGEVPKRTTPPPFAADTATSGVSIQSLRREPQRLAAPAIGGRSILWPVLAISGVAIAAVALFLVWRQMQREQPPPVVNITTTSTDPTNPGKVPSTEPGQVPDAAPAPVVADATPREPSGSGEERPPRRPLPGGATSDPRYKAALAAKGPAVNQCATEHAPPPARIDVEIEIARDGTPKTITLSPASIVSTPLGACIKKVLAQTRFPASKDEFKAAVTFRPKP